MIQSFQSLAQSAVMERAMLLVNHIISAEPVAVERLLRHSGSSLQVEFTGWPALLPALPVVALRITPAGLIEWLGAERLTAPDLRIEVDASNPALAAANLLGGARPAVSVAGDAALAGDVNWLIGNLRWDVQDDLARLVGSGPAQVMSRVGRAVAGGIRDAARTLAGLVSKETSSAPGGRGGL